MGDSYLKFYQLKKPKAFYLTVGTSRSNSYYGSARISQPVVRRTTLPAGTIIGNSGETLYAMVDGKMVTAAFWPPPEPLERRYGPGTSFAIEQGVRYDEMMPVDEPANLQFHKGPLKQFPDYHPSVIEDPPDRAIENAADRLVRKLIA